jgi:hypothetical protein
MKDKFNLVEKINYHFSQTFAEFRILVNDLPENLWKRYPLDYKEAMKKVSIKK